MKHPICHFLLKRWTLLCVIVGLLIIVPFTSLLVIHAHAAPSGTATLTLSKSNVQPGASVIVTGQGFGADETVKVEIEYNPIPGDIWLLGTIPCDNNGTCSQAIRIVFTCPSQGDYTVIATGETSGDKATAPLEIHPFVDVTPRGGPGSTVYVEGDGFARYEQHAYIYWGDAHGLKEGLASVDECGNLYYQFNIPTNVTPGNYTVTVARDHQQPETLSRPYQVLSPSVTVESLFRPGLTAKLHLVGFQAGEQVTVSWNANGGQKLISFYVNEDGGSGTWNNPQPIPVPATPRGHYTVTVVGNTSKLKASAIVTVIPDLLLSPSDLVPGESFTATGGGFTPGEQVIVTLQDGITPPVTVAVGSDGSFTTSLTVPNNEPYGTYTVVAQSTTGKDSASAQLLVE